MTNTIALQLTTQFPIPLHSFVLLGRPICTYRGMHECVYTIMYGA